MPQWIRHDDPRLTWQGAISLHRTPDWTMPWRLPHAQLGLFPVDDLQTRAKQPVGVRISFRSDTTHVGGTLDPNPEMTQAQLCCDGELWGTVPLGNQSAFRFEGLPARDKWVELWLPHYGEFHLRGLELSDGATLAPFDDRRPRWVTYGSSITQCKAAESPTQTWPAIVARARGLNLTNLGYSGQCHLDPQIARLIRGLPADVLSLCVGVNIYTKASLGRRAFRSFIIGFVQIVREGHPDTPLALISPIHSPIYDEPLNAVDLNLIILREEVAEAAAALQTHGDHNLHYFNGMDILGPEHAHLLPDGVHPNAEGYKVLGQRFLERAMAKLWP